MKKLILFSLALIIGSGLFSQEVPYHQTPDWISTADGQFATGLGLGDINGDGFKDIVVSNGNDMARQLVSVYYNDGEGNFELMPDWEAGDIDYHGHLALGDFNNDGWLDVAVSVFIGTSGFSSPGKLKVYYNQGGELETLPSFESQPLYSFSCAAGDADGDGDLDIAVACGEPYYGILDHAKVFYNDNGNFSDGNIWESGNQMIASDVEFIDIDLNGFLDLVFVCTDSACAIYLADNLGSIPADPSWRSTDGPYNMNSVDVGYNFNENGETVSSYIVITNNSQLGGDGKVRRYTFNSQPFSTTADWQSTWFGMGSGINLYDVTENDSTDLLYGGWWEPMKIALATEEGYELNTSYTSSTNSVVEAIHLADLGEESFVGQLLSYEFIDTSNLIILPHQNVEKIDHVIYGCIAIPFKHIPGKNRIVLEENILPGEKVDVMYFLSPHADIVITNWDDDIGNYIFYNTNSPIGIKEPESNYRNKIVRRIYPNPATDYIKLELNPETKENIQLKLISFKGDVIAEYKVKPESKNFIISAKNFTPGLYILESRSADNIQFTKFVIIN